MQSATSGRVSSAATAAAERFAWLSNPTLLLCIAGVVLPNALSLGALLGGIGAPPRPAAIIAYATVVLVARLAPPLVTVGLYLATAVYDAVSTVALLFNLAPSEIGLALHLGAELRLFSSPLYVALMAALAALVVANIAVLVRKRDLLQRGNPALMLGFALSFLAVDFLTNTSAHYQFGTLYSAGKPMESAAGASGFRQAALTGNNRHLLLVVVEALGQFADPARQALLLQPFADADLNKRYRVTTGSTTYYGSTTAAEMRELCNTREPYEALLEGKELVCLPEQMAARGYQTISLHNFTSAFFGRHQWYPKLGFEKRFFASDLSGSVHRLCGGPFRGPCDVDVVPFIGRELREAKKPTLFYWMTLSTHVPVAPREGTPRFGCENGGSRIGHAEVCYMTEMWVDLWESIVRMTAEIPATEILLVGDHAPPLWSKAGRQLFTPGQVTWVRLTPRAGAPQVSGLH
ncbi:MAG: sulfatase-like hydrolase/transferase [Xanthobacteraceae bacterium]